MNVLVTIPACSHQRPERHAHRGLRDDGVPVLHVQPVPARLQVEPICTRLRQLRVVVQELEQDDDKVVTPRPEPQHAAMSDQNRALGKRPTDKRKKKRGDYFLLQEYYQRGNYFVLQF